MPEYFIFSQLLATMTLATETFAMQLKNQQRLLALLALSCFLLSWLSHNALLGSPMGTLIEAVCIGSGLIGFYRHYIAPKTQQTPRHFQNPA